MPLRSVICTALAVGAVGLGAPAAANAAFTAVASPNAFTGNNDLNGVGASSASDAWAVGTLGGAFEDSAIGTLTEHFNGTAWTVVPSPDRVHIDDELNAVADLSPTNAWAVGLVKGAGTKTGSPLIVHWDGLSWQTGTAPAGVSGVLRAISADSASDIWAVGDDGRGHAIAFRFGGTSWSTTTLPAAGVDKLAGVKAFAPNDVWAVGTQITTAAPQTRTLIMHWNGSAWSIVPSANPNPTTDSLRAVDGTSSHDLWAVGQQAPSETITGARPGARTLTEHFDGSRWIAVASPSTGDDDSLNGVAAVSPTAVSTVGSVDDRTGAIPVSRTLAEQFTGTSWSIVPSVNIGSTDNLLMGAARIPGTSAVWAVGFHLTAVGPDQTLIERGS
jgi:hypothetical protein